MASLKRWLLTQYFKRSWSRSINDVIGWENLRQIGSARTVKSSYIWFAVVPIAARFFEKLSEVAHITVLGEEWLLTLELPFSWKCFYFASLAFAIGTLIYSIRCPAIIKSTKDFREFSDRHDSELFIRMAVVKYTKTVGQTEPLAAFAIGFCKPARHKFPEEHEVKDVVRSSSGPSLIHRIAGGTLRVSEDQVSNAYLFARGLVSSLYPLSRLACAFAYTIGSIFLLAVIVDALFYVTSATF